MIFGIGCLCPIIRVPADYLKGTSDGRVHQEKTMETSPRSPLTLDGLPDECVLNILGHVAHPRTRTLYLVSRRFYRLSADNILWKPTFKRLSSPHLVSRIERMCATRKHHLDKGLDQTDVAAVRISFNGDPDNDDDDSNAVLDPKDDERAHDFGDREDGQQRCWKEWTRLLTTTVVETVMFDTYSESEDRARTVWAEGANLGWKCRTRRLPLRKVRTSRALANAVASEFGMPLLRMDVWLVAHDAAPDPQGSSRFAPLRLLHAPRADRPLGRSEFGLWWEAMWARLLFNTTRDGTAQHTLIVITVGATPVHRPGTLTVPVCVAKHNAGLVDPDDDSTSNDIPWYKHLDGQLTLNHMGSPCAGCLSHLVLPTSS